MSGRQAEEIYKKFMEANLKEERHSMGFIESYRVIAENMTEQFLRAREVVFQQYI